VNQRWVSDLTEVPTGQGVLYLASVLDLNSRRAVGYALGAHHDAELAVAAVQVAIAVRGGDVAGVVFHSDQGGEFTGAALARVCARAGIIQSMGRTGSALDNAVAESFHSPLEFELLSRNRFATHAEARAAVVAWLEEYNTSSWSDATQHGTEAIVVSWATTTCGPCPAKALCTTGKRRHITLRSREAHEALVDARARQTTTEWKA
jgi:transposase InsO family protein